MPTRTTAARTGAIAAAVWLGLQALPAAADPAADAERLRTRALAANCAHCHGTEGRALGGQAMTRLAGQPERTLVDQLEGFRSGQRPATVMHQIARGYTPQQVQALAKFFAAQK